MVSKNVKLLRWSISLGFVSLVIAYFFINALNDLTGSWLKEHAIWIAIVTGILLVLFMTKGIISVKALYKKFT